MQFMPTNDIFHHLIKLLQIHKDKDFIIELFESEGIHVTKSLIKAWATKAGVQKAGYREMPRETLNCFIAALYKEKIVE